MKTTKSVLIVANGETQSNLDQVVCNHDFVIAVDGGLHHLLSLGLFPDLLIGDLDSITEDELKTCQDQHVEILRFKPEKDESDLELALREAKKRNFGKFTIACATGGRLDHTFSNIALLFHPSLQGDEVSIQGEKTRVFMVDNEITLDTSPGDIISLFPWGEPALGVDTVGLAYPLTYETLLPYETRGLSNVCLANQASVSLQQGQLLLFHISFSTQERYPL